MSNNNMSKLNRKVKIYRKLKKLLSENKDIKTTITYLKSDIPALEKELKRIDKKIKDKPKRNIPENISEILNKDVTEADLFFNQHFGDFPEAEGDEDIVTKNTKQLINENIKNMDLTNITVLIVEVVVKISEETRKKVINVIVKDGVPDLSLVDNWVSGFDGGVSRFFNIESITVIGTKGKTEKVSLKTRKKIMRKGKVKSIKYVKLPYKVESNNILFHYNCVHEYLTSISKKCRFVKAIKKIEKSKIWTVDDIINFCELHKVTYNIYNYSLELIFNKTYGTKRKGLRCIISNEHIYPVEEKELILIKNNYKTDNFYISDIKYIPSCEINNFVYNKMLTIGCSKFKITYKKENKIQKISADAYYERALFDSVLYVSDEELYNSYNLIKSCVDNFDLLIPFNVSTNRIFSFFMEKYNANSICYNFLEKPAPINYYNKRLDEEDNINCYDKNKAYLNNLIELDYIPILDFSCEIKEYTKRVVVDGYEESHKFSKYNFYFVEQVKKNMFGILEAGKWYSGFRFLNIKDKSIFEVSKYIEPKLIKNFLKPLLKKMIKKDIDIARSIVNKFIGFSQISKDNITVNIQDGLFTTVDEAKDYMTSKKLDGIEIIKINQDEILYNCHKNVDIKATHQVGAGPLAFYIVDKCVNKVIKLIKDLREEDNSVRIVKIETDSVSFISNNNLCKNYINKDDITKWKIIDFTKKNNSILRGTNFNYEPYKIEFQKYTKFQKGNLFFNCWAGSGKTYTVINDILPNITDNYVVLACQHSALYEYRKLGLTNMTLQKYINLFSIGKKPNHDYIIIDEAGLIDYHLFNRLFSNIKKDVQLIFLGDDKQLTPVLNNMNNIDFVTFGNEYIMSLFNTFYKKNENYRNNYTLGDYKKMLSGKYKLSQEEEKFFVSTKDANSKNSHPRIRQLFFNYFKKNINPYIICYKNDTKDHLNDMFTKHWEKCGTVEKDDKIITKKIFNNGIVTCLDNKLSKQEIYNNTVCIVKTYTPEKVELKYYDHNDGEYGEIITIEMKQYIKYFIPAYAFTLYKTQGRGINDRLLCFCDKKILITKPTRLYTVLSRRKQKLTKKNKTYTNITRTTPQVQHELDIVF